MIDRVDRRPTAQPSDSTSLLVHRPTTSERWKHTRGWNPSSTTEPASALMFFGSNFRLPFLLETLTTCTWTMQEGAGDMIAAEAVATAATGDVSTAATIEVAVVVLTDP